MPVQVKNLPNVVDRRDQSMKLIFFGILTVEMFWIAFLIWLPLLLFGIVGGGGDAVLKITSAPYFFISVTHYILPKGIRNSSEGEPALILKSALLRVPAYMFALAATCFTYFAMSRFLIVALDGPYQAFALKVWMLLSAAAVLFL